MKHRFYKTGSGMVVVGILLGLFCPAAASRLQAVESARLSEVSLETPAADPAEQAQDREVDRQHLRQIYQAIMAFKKQKGDLPDYLSELFPEFLQDTNVLVSPEHARTGKFPSTSYKDPKLETSYSYQFSTAPAGQDIGSGDALTMKQWKKLQMDEFGEAVPLLRIRWQDPAQGERSLAITCGGQLIETGRFWESDTNTWELMAKLGPAPGVREARKLRVQAQDSRGQPLPGATVLARNRRSEFGTLPPRTLTTDADGRCEVNLGGKQPRSLTLEVSKAGFSSQQARWTSEAEIPEEWTAKLAKAVTVGGLVRNTEGQPIAAATVVVNGTAKDPVGQVLLTEYDTVLTDAAGQWSSSRVPEVFESLSFKLSHPEYMPAEYDQAIGADTGEALVKKDDLLAGRALMKMEPGIVVGGTVVDNKKQTLAAAGVTLVWSAGEEDEQRLTIKRAKTDADGRFRFVVTQGGNATVVAEATGFAPRSEQIEMQHGLAPVALELEKGRVVQGQVLDPAGKPVTGADVRVGQWNELSVLTWHTNTDTAGRFAWSSAPLEAFTLSVGRSNFLSAWHQVEEDQSDVQVRLERPFQLAGKVTDAETRQPVTSFKLYPGYTWNETDEYFRWERYNGAEYRNGQYAITSENRRGGKVKYLCEAEGYLPAASTPFVETGSHTYDFELKRGRGLSGVVQLAGGEPAEKATVVLVDKTSSGYMDKSGEFRTDISESRHALTDSQGRFQLPPSLDADAVLVAHEKGYAEAPAEQVAASGKIVLQPWGRVEGVVKVPVKPDQAVRVALHSMYYRYGQRNRQVSLLSLYLNTTPDEQGNFVFEKAPPGNRRVYLQYKLREGPGTIPLSHGQFIRVEPGQTAKVTLGGAGRPVVGCVQVKGGDLSDVDWTKDVHQLSLIVTNRVEQDAPYGKKFDSEAERQRAMVAYDKKLKEYWTSAEGLKAQQQEKSYVLLFDESGAFRVEDVPPGRYTLQISPTDPTAERYQFRQLGSLTKEVTVPEAPAGQRGEAVDLGTLELTIRRSLSIGKPAPELTVKTLEDKPLKLSDYRGKYLLLTFWQAASPPSLSEVPALKAVYEAFSKNNRFAMLSLSLDPEKQMLQDLLKKRQLRWDQAYLGAQGWNELAPLFNVQRLPTTFLIDPEGRVLARDLRGQTLRKVVSKVLSEP